MPKIPDDIIRHIEETAKIEEVVGDCNVELRKAGVNLTGLCPFHDDRHDGNFIVRPSTISEKNGGNTYRCFVCDAKGGPVQFLMEHEGLSFPDAIRWLGKKYSIPVDDVPLNYTPPPPRPTPPPLPMLELPRTMVEGRRDLNQDLLYQWIATGINWDPAQRQRIDQVMADYHVGHSPKNGMTIFWQIDDQQRVHTGKMMRYKADGHRDKQIRYNFDFIHASLARGIPKRDEQGKILRDEEGQVIYDNTVFKHIYDEDKQKVEQCLFGLHLLNRYRKGRQQQEVRIVESEKTALLMAIAYGNTPTQVWMACGGAENLTRQRLLPIINEGREIIIYPDRDGIDRWKAKAANIGYSKITVDATPVTRWWLPEDGEKADIADVVVRITNSRRCGKPLSLHELLTYHPQLKPFIDRLQLQPRPNEDREREICADGDKGEPSSG